VCGHQQYLGGTRLTCVLAADERERKVGLVGYTPTMTAGRRLVADRSVKENVTRTTSPRSTDRTASRLGPLHRLAAGVIIQVRLFLHPGERAAGRSERCQLRRRQRVLGRRVAIR